MAPRVGFVGVGAMGLPMVERIAGAGLDVSAVVRRPELAEQLAQEGIGVVGDVATLADRSDVLVVCTFSDAQLREVVFGREGAPGALSALRPGAVLVNHVTGSPALAEAMAGAAPPGAAIVDAPISGSPDQVRAGHLTVLAGADANALELARPVIATYASTIIHVGKIGDAQRIKLINNLVFAAHLHIATLAADLAASMGIGAGDLASALGHCSGASFPLSMLEHQPAASLVAGARPFLSKDLAVVQRIATELGLDLGTLGSLAARAVGERPGSSSDAG